MASKRKRSLSLQRKTSKSRENKENNPPDESVKKPKLAPEDRKNHSGGLSDLRVPNKQVPCYSIPENRPKCLVYLLDLYFSKVPEYAFVKDILYLRP